MAIAMVENTKQNGTQNVTANGANAANAQNQITVNVPKTNKSHGQLISESKAVIKNMAYSKDAQAKNEFSELLKAVKETESTKEIKKMKRVVKGNFKRLYRMFEKEQPYERIAHMNDFYTLNSKVLEAMRANKKFYNLTKMDKSLSKQRHNAHKTLLKKTEEAKDELNRNIKAMARKEKGLEKRVSKLKEKTESTKEDFADASKELSKMTRENQRLEELLRNGKNYLNK